MTHFYRVVKVTNGGWRAQVYCYSADGESINLWTSPTIESSYDAALRQAFDHCDDDAKSSWLDTQAQYWLDLTANQCCVCGRSLKDPRERRVCCCDGVGCDGRRQNPRCEYCCQHEDNYQEVLEARFCDE